MKKAKKSVVVVDEKTKKSEDKKQTPVIRLPERAEKMLKEMAQRPPMHKSGCETV